MALFGGGCHHVALGVELCMRPSWDTFWTNDSLIETMLAPLAPSAVQRQFLQGLTPVDAPAIGLELSSRGLRRRPHIAVWLLSGRLQRWSALLQPLVRADGTFASGLAVEDLQPFIQSQDLFDRETWLEYTQPLRRQGGQPFLLFRHTRRPLRLDELRHQLEALHGRLGSRLQQRLPLPSDAWWQALQQIPQAGADQLGIDLDPLQGGWRFLFGVTDPQALLAALGFEPPLGAGLEAFPLALALDSRRVVADRYCLEVFPRYRQDHTIIGYPGEIPADVDQWPAWTPHPALIPPARLKALMQATVHVPSVAYSSQQLALRGGLSHQKLVVEEGQLVDHKAYLGVMVTAAKATQAASVAAPEGAREGSPVDHAIQWLSQAADGWLGFALSPGHSDQWVPLACLTLLAQWRDEPQLMAAYARQREALEPLLQAPQPVGYSRLTPADLDSSIWLRRCLLSLQRPSSASLDRFLASGWSRDVGISTYSDPQLIAAFIERQPAEMTGWCAPHDCVLINWAADPSMPKSGAALQHLRDRLNEGRFRSYWWPLDGLILSLMPRGSLPRSVVQGCLQQSLPPAVERVLPPLYAERFQALNRGLLLMRHGTIAEQQQGNALMATLIRRPEDFRDLLVMQLPQPDQLDPDADVQWLWKGRMEGSLAPDPEGYLAAALFLATQVRSK